MEALGFKEPRGTVIVIARRSITSSTTLTQRIRLEAKRWRLGPKVVNSAYGAMTARLEARNNPSLLVMAYDEGRTRVAAGAERPPRRLAGCNILIGQGPAAGRIPLIRGGLHVPKAAVLDQWRSTLFRGTPA